MKVKCISKNRNNKGVIVNYTLQDETGRQFTATAKEIKDQFIIGQYEFVNLQIDKAGRLIDKRIENQEVKPIQRKSTQKASKSQSKPEQSKEQLKDQKKKQIENEVKAYFNEATANYLDPVKQITLDMIEISNSDEANPLLTNNVRKWFNRLAKLVVNEVKTKGRIEASGYGYEDEDWSVGYPEIVERALNILDNPRYVSEALFKYISYTYETSIGYIECGVDDMSDGFCGSIALTSDLKNSKEFIMNYIEQEAANQGETLEDYINEYEINVNGANARGIVDYLKVDAELQHRDLKYYKKELLEQIIGKYGIDNYLEKYILVDLRTKYFAYDNDTKLANYYLALKYSIQPLAEMDEDYSKASKEIIRVDNILKKEAKALADEIRALYE